MFFCLFYNHPLSGEGSIHPAGCSSLPSDTQAWGSSLFSCSQFPIFLLLKNKKQKKIPPQSSYTHKLFRFKPFWNPGTKAISFINHLPPTPLCPLHPSSERKLTTENSVILWLSGERRIPPPRLPGDTTRNPTIVGRTNACDNLRHLGRYYTSPSNMLASHVCICFYFWLG